MWEMIDLVAAAIMPRFGIIGDGEAIGSTRCETAADCARCCAGTSACSRMRTCRRYPSAMRVCTGASAQRHDRDDSLTGRMFIHDRLGFIVTILAARRRHRDDHQPLPSADPGDRTRLSDARLGGRGAAGRRWPGTRPHRVAAGRDSSTGSTGEQRWSRCPCARGSGGAVRRTRSDCGSSAERWRRSCSRCVRSQLAESRASGRYKPLSY